MILFLSTFDPNIDSTAAHISTFWTFVITFNVSSSLSSVVSSMSNHWTKTEPHCSNTAASSSSRSFNEELQNLAVPDTAPVCVFNCRFMKFYQSIKIWTGRRARTAETATFTHLYDINKTVAGYTTCCVQFRVHLPLNTDTRQQPYGRSVAPLPALKLRAH